MDLTWLSTEIWARWKTLIRWLTECLQGLSNSRKMTFKIHLQQEERAEAKSLIRISDLNSLSSLQYRTGSSLFWVGLKIRQRILSVFPASFSRPCLAVLYSVWTCVWHFVKLSPQKHDPMIPIISIHHADRRWYLYIWIYKVTWISGFTNYCIM